MSVKMQLLHALAVFAAIGSASASPAENNYNFDYGFDPAVVSNDTVDYTDSNGTALRGYFAYANSTTTGRPAVVVIPDYDGIGPYERWRANLLAQLGYAAFVADIYGVNQTQGPALNMSESSALSSMYGMNPDLLLDRVGAAVAEAQMQSMVMSNATVVIGYCFGGSAVLDLAASWPEAATENVLGVMAFHAGSPPSAMIDMSPSNPIRISVQQGFDDPSIAPDAALSTQQMWESMGVKWEWTWYSQTVHAFTEPQGVGAAASSTAAYSATADERSWQALRTFLLDLFGYVTPQNEYANTTTADTVSSFA
uniref:Putative extracellular protein TR9_020 n=1 Tax=Trebouxia lynnae TaxID=1825957 RepID=A0A7L9QEE4_9CHLO|nr:putative extracellular protein TR9_020 [Trebouxia lynnae]